jgi:pimeloyl-ACP methyl ester carboxylesterase
MKAGKIVLRGAGVLVVLALVAGVGFYLRPIEFFNVKTYVQEVCFRGVESKTTQVAGHKVHYLVEGPADGPALVLVHGLGGRGEDYWSLAPLLAKAGFRVYRPDMFGYGRSDKPADFSYAVHDEAEMVTGFLDAVGLKQVELCGWSMGGGVVQYVAYRHPERVSRLILLDSVGPYAKPTWDVNLFIPRSTQDMDELGALLTPHYKTAPAFVMKDLLRVYQERGWILRRAIDAMMKGNEATDAILPQLKMPVLMLWGSIDQITPLSMGEKMHQLVPQSQLEVIPGCGHMAPAECADQMAPKMISFLQQH